MAEYTENELRYIDKLDDFKARSIEALDRHLLTLSAGSIVLSITFVKTFITSFPAPYELALKFSWVLFLVTIALVLVSYLFSIKSMNAKFEEIRARMRKRTNKPGKKQEANNNGGKRLDYDGTVTVLRFTSGITFIAGLSLITLFSISNLKESQMSENDRVERIDNGDDSESRGQDQSSIKGLEIPFNILDDGDEDSSQDSQQGNQGSEEDSSQTSDE